jgi:DNA-directed RNA polymerase specialized sigma subunit
MRSRPDFAYQALEGAMSKKIDDFLEKAASLRTPEQEARYQELKGRRTKELKLWHDWHQGGRKEEDLQPLLKSLDPLVRSEATKRLSGLGGSIPRAALHNALRNAAQKAVTTYDPQKGTQLTTHVVTNFQRVTDFVAANRNAKYMPKEHVDTYEQFRGAKTELHEELGREPTHHELMTKLPGWGLPKIKKMSKGFGPEVYTDMGTDFEDQAAKLHPRDAYMLVKSKMPEMERQFAELHFPEEGPGHNVQNIAKQLGISKDKAYRLKAKVERRLQGVLKNE